MLISAEGNGTSTFSELVRPSHGHIYALSVNIFILTSCFVNQ